MMKKKKDYFKREDNKRKRESCDNLDDDKKEQLRKFEKKGKKVMCGKLEAGEKEKIRKNGKKRKMDKRLRLVLTWR